MAEAKLNLDVEALASSAAHVAGQADDLATAHLSSDNQIEAAQSGWVGSSAAAMKVKSAEWLATSNSLLSRVGGHAMDLNDDGVAFAAADRASTATLHEVGDGA